MAKFIFQAGVFFKRPLYPANTSTVVTVYDAETGSIAPVWNDRAGADPRANPGPIWQEGQIKLYLNAGRYNIVASNGSDSKTWNDVIIVDPDAGWGGGVQEIKAGVGIFVDSSDPARPVVSATGDTSRDAVHTISNASGTVTLNVGLYNFFLVEMVGDITILNLTGVEPGKAYSVAVQFVQSAAGGHQIAWPSSFQFTKGSETEISDTPGSYNLLGITTLTDGYRWIATLGVQDS